MTDISTMYTKDRNMKTGRKGYCLWKDEKETAIALQLMVTLLHSIEREVRRDD